MMIVAKKGLPGDNRALHRYARRFYLQHYRVPRFGVKQGDYALQAVGSLLAGTYAVAQIGARMHAQDEMGTALAVILAVILAWSTLHGLGKMLELRMEATAFADEAILIAESQAEVEQFFDDTYPWIFYHK